jgi:hypothetical protein
MIIIGLTVLIGTLVVVGTDIYLAIKGGFPATLSYWMMLNSARYPIIPSALCLIIGILIGHFEWSQQLNVSIPCPVSQ